MTTKKSTTDKSKSPNFTATIPVFFERVTLMPLPKEFWLPEEALGHFAKEPSPFEKLQAIQDKALALSQLPYDASRGWPANVHSQAKRIVSQAKECITALEGNDVVAALAHGYQLGEMIQKISTHLALNDSFNHQKTALNTRVDAGKERQKPAQKLKAFIALESKNIKPGQSKKAFAKMLLEKVKEEAKKVGHNFPSDEAASNFTYGAVLKALKPCTSAS